MRVAVTNLNHALVKLSSLTCSHPASLILRQCLGSARVAYLIRRFSAGLLDGPALALDVGRAYRWDVG